MVVAMQIASVLLFVVLALVEGDSWGIAKGMALLLACPLVALSLPALLLYRWRYRWSAAALGTASALTSGVAWWLA